MFVVSAGSATTCSRTLTNVRRVLGPCGSYCDYILDHLDSMPKDKKELRAAMRLVVYMDHLMRLFETPFVLRTNRGDSSFGTGSGGLGPPLVLCSRLQPCPRDCGR